MNTENKSLGILKDGNEVFVGDLVIYPESSAVWRVLGTGYRDTKIKAELVSGYHSNYSIGNFTEGLRPDRFCLKSRASSRAVDNWQAGVRKHIGTIEYYHQPSEWVIATSPSAPVVIRNCQCQSLFMNGHNHSCHMYVAPAPTINVWGIPQPVDNSQLIETIKNSDDKLDALRRLFKDTSKIANPTFPDIDKDEEWKF